MNKHEFLTWCKHRHDVEVDQKYDHNILYSKHLEYVVANARRFRSLLGSVWNDRGIWTDWDLVEMGCWGHDLIEDARITYNDLVEKVGPQVADIIYCCTEEKGKDREGRHNVKYYMELAENRLAVFVKLCDIMANVTYSILTGSTMYPKHKREHEKTMKYLYREEFKPMYEYLDKLFALWP
jgi:hypothetical protein